MTSVLKMQFDNNKYIKNPWPTKSLTIPVSGILSRDDIVSHWKELDPDGTSIADFGSYDKFVFQNYEIIRSAIDMSLFPSVTSGNYTARIGFASYSSTYNLLVLCEENSTNQIKNAHLQSFIINGGYCLAS